MKIRSALFCALLTLGSIQPALNAQPTASASAEEDTTELGRHMSAISRAFKKLRTQVADSAKNEESLQLVATIREHAHSAMALVPEKALEVAAPDQPKFKSDYVAKMESLIASVDQLDAAFKAGNNDEAKRLLEAMANAQKEGHKEFRKKKPEKK
jgi:soluble cytochrome b562